MDTAEQTPTAIEIAYKAIAHLEAGRPEEALRVLQEMVGSQPPPQSLVIFRDFETSFLTACRKNQVPAAAYAIFRPRGPAMQVVTGGHARAMATLDQMIRDALLWQRSVKDAPRQGAGSKMAAVGAGMSAGLIEKGGHA